MIALDASALLALLFKEQGHERVAEAMVSDECWMSTVNLAEVLARFSRDGHSSLQVLSRLQATSIEWMDFDGKQAALSADFLPRTRALGLSLGDRACLALATTLACRALTADAAWRAAEVGVEIELIR